MVQQGVWTSRAGRQLVRGAELPCAGPLSRPSAEQPVPAQIGGAAEQTQWTAPPDLEHSFVFAATLGSWCKLGVQRTLTF